MKWKNIPDVALSVHTRILQQLVPTKVYRVLKNHKEQGLDLMCALCHSAEETVPYLLVESFRFEDENEDEDEDEALGFRHKEIFKLFRLQRGRDNVVAINFVVPAKLKTKKFEDFVVAKTDSFVLVLDFVLVLESKAL